MLVKSLFSKSAFKNSISTRAGLFATCEYNSNIGIRLYHWYYLQIIVLTLYIIGFGDKFSYKTPESANISAFQHLAKESGYHYSNLGGTSTSAFCLVPLLHFLNLFLLDYRSTVALVYDMAFSLPLADSDLYYPSWTENALSSSRCHRSFLSTICACIYNTREWFAKYDQLCSLDPT